MTLVISQAEAAISFCQAYGFLLSFKASSVLAGINLYCLCERLAWGCCVTAEGQRFNKRAKKINSPMIYLLCYHAALYTRPKP